MLDSESLADHIKITNDPDVERYTASGGGGSDPRIKERSRNNHGNRIKSMLERVKFVSDRLKVKTSPANLIKDQGTYIEFTSPLGHDLIVDSLHRTRSGIELVQSIKIYKPNEDGALTDYTRAVVYVPDGKIDIFINIVQRYLTEEYSDSDKPKSKDFVESIEEIKVATLKSFWTDTIDFPDDNDSIWWEVWVRTHTDKERYEVTPIESLLEQVSNYGLEQGEEILEFPEHKVVLVKGTAIELSGSILLLNNLAEVRKAKERADFFTEYISSIEQEDWIEDLVERLEIRNENSPVICFLDSGVNNSHALLEPVIPNSKLDTYKPSWGTNDTARSGGHGTLMAGLAIYGDLTPLLASRDRVQIFHRIESVKIVEQTDPQLYKNYGAITKECVARSFVIDPDSFKIFCMAVTTRDFRDLGQPSSWSSAIDSLTSRNQDDETRKLFFISGGNVEINTALEFPDKNLTDQVHDPGQSWNAITVGSYTENVEVNNDLYPDYFPLAEVGQMAPTNSTSILWKNEWPYKPDLVFEGGNLAQDLVGDVVYDDALQLLSTSKDHRLRPLRAFGATSAASSLASRFASTVKRKYSDFWPETVRGLMVHSSEWTPSMLGHRNLNELSKTEINSLTRQVGYGVPNLNTALNSASNSLTLIAQNYLKPYRLDGNDVKTDNIHLHELPWPREELLALGEVDVKLKVTLSYFIEPNPGRKFYSSKFYYQSYGLRFDVIRVTETIEDFKKRVNKAARGDSYSGTDTQTENWLFGSRNRTRGSLHKDVWFGNAADLATKNNLVIYPVSGWWRTRKNLERYTQSVPYSLIVSIETPITEIDIYTPVQNKITIET